MTFKVCNNVLNDPHLLHKMGFVDSQFGTTVLGSNLLPYLPLEGEKKLFIILFFNVTTLTMNIFYS